MAVIADFTVDALQTSAQTISVECAGDIASHLTCAETDALATMLALCGNGTTATQLLNSHAESDEEGDLHHRMTPAQIDDHLDDLT